MKPTTLALVVTTAALCACERRGPAVSADASTTSATAPLGERSLEPPEGHGAAAHAPAEGPPGVSGAVAGGADAGDGARAPAWVPSGAALTVVHGADRDRNLGLVAPAAPTITFAVDAGAYEVDVSVRPRP